MKSVFSIFFVLISLFLHAQENALKDATSTDYEPIITEYYGSGGRQFEQIIDALSKVGKIKCTEMVESYGDIKNSKTNTRKVLKQSLNVQIGTIKFIQSSDLNFSTYETKKEEYKIMFSCNINFNINRSKLICKISMVQTNLNDSVSNYYNICLVDSTKELYWRLNKTNSAEELKEDIPALKEFEEDLVEYVKSLGFKISFYTSNNNETENVVKLEISRDVLEKILKNEIS